MRWGTLALVGALCLPITADAKTLITHNRGGWIPRFAMWVNTAPGPIVLDGDCVSACTMMLYRRDLCATPRAVLGFHQAYTRQGPSARGTQWMASYWRAGIAEWITAHGGLPYGRPIYLRAPEIWNYVPRCKP